MRSSDAQSKPDVTGSLARYPLPRLLFYLCKRRFTGRLCIAGEGAAARRMAADPPGCNVYFCDGLPAWSDLRTAEDVLGRVLLERGVIDSATYERSLHELARGERRHGEILRAMGVLDEQQLIGGLRLQLRRRLIRLFRLEDGRFELFAGAHGYGARGEERSVRVDPLFVIYHGVRNAGEGAVSKRELSKLRGARVALAPRPASLWKRYGFDESEQVLITTLERGGVAVDDLPRISHLSAGETNVVIYTLWVTEALEVEARPDRPAAPTPSPPPAAGVEQAPAVIASPPPPAASVEQAPAVIASPPPPAAGVEQAPAVIASPPPPAAGVEQAPAVIASPPPPAAGVEQAPAVIASPPPPAQRERSAPRRSRGDDAETEARRERILALHAELEQLDHYQLLEVAHDASSDEIRQSYFALAKRYHPDRVSGMGLGEIAGQAEEIFRALSEAHSVLTDSEGRAEYDRRLQGGSGSTAADEHAHARRVMEGELAFQQGMVFFRKRAYVEAREHFERALACNEEEGEHLAWLLWSEYCDPRLETTDRLGKLQQGLQRATQLSPRSAQCHYFRGEILLEMGDERRAFGCFEKTLELQANHVDAQRRLRMIRMRRERGDKGKGKGLFSRLRKK